MTNTNTTDTRIYSLLPGRSVALSSARQDGKTLRAERSGDGKTICLYLDGPCGFEVLSRQPF